jgi:hypothetical protein
MRLDKFEELVLREASVVKPSIVSPNDNKTPMKANPEITNDLKKGLQKKQNEPIIQNPEQKELEVKKRLDGIDKELEQINELKNPQEKEAKMKAMNSKLKAMKTDATFKKHISIIEEKIKSTEEKGEDKLLPGSGESAQDLFDKAFSNPFDIDGIKKAQVMIKAGMK